MKTKFLMAVGVLLTMWAVIYLSLRSPTAEMIFTVIIRLGFLALVVGGSIHKLALWWRYRHDPAKREAIAYSTGFYSSKLRKFFYDE